MSRSKRRIGITLLALLLLIVSPVWITYREYRQAQLDHALIEAIIAKNDAQAFEALAEGASGEARDAGAPPTFTEALSHLLDHFRHPRQKEEVAHTPALLLLYQQDFLKSTLQSVIKPNASQFAAGPDLMLVKSLLDHGANVNDQDGIGSPLLYASMFYERDNVRFLLNHGANTELTNDQKQTALMCAASAENTEVVRLLLEHHANVHAKDVQGKTAFDYTRQFEKEYPTANSPPKIAALLRQYGAK